MQRNVLLFLIVALVPLYGAAAEPQPESPWQLVREGKTRSDVTTWVRPVPRQTLKAFKGEVEVPHEMLTVFAVLADVERYPEWVFQCSNARLMPEYGYDIAYVHIRGIWPVSDRDIVTRTEIEQDDLTGAITLHTRAAPGLHPPRENTVRVTTLDNKFILTPLPDGWTRITFDTFVDPGGSIPAWLANLVAVRAPRDTLEGMAALMGDGKYRIASVEETGLDAPGLNQLRFEHPPATPAQRASND